MKRLYKEPEDISEALSAYVDDELDPAERREVEELIADNASYAQEVEELRLLKSWLRELPAPQPRRSFTLDPASAPQRRRLIFPMLRWATAVAALLLMLTVGVDVLGGAGDTAQTSAPEAAMTLRSMPEEGAAGGAQEGSEAAAASPAAGSENEPAPDAAGEQEPAPDMGALTGPEASPETEEQADAAAMADEEPLAADEDVAGVDTTEVDPSQTDAASPTTTLRIIQWVLLATTLALGVGAWLAWRRNL